jgi:hypothetical protein
VIKSTIKCEYLVDNKRCQAIKENKEGISVRNMSCTNKLKDACCYTCDSKEKCDVSCDLFDKERLYEHDKSVFETTPYDKGSTRDDLIILGLVLMGIGLFVAVALPYPINSSYTYYNSFTYRYETVTSTITVYGHPIGWIPTGIGFFLLLIGLMTHPSGSKPSTTRRTFRGKVCGDCHFFGAEDCPRQEKMFNAMPCEDFTP